MNWNVTEFSLESVEELEWFKIHTSIYFAIFLMNAISSIVSIFGCFGNVFIVLIISRWDKLTSAATIMLILAVFDFLSTFYVAIFNIGLPFLDFNLRNINHFSCAFLSFSSAFIIYTSYYVTVLFSFDKFLSVMFPFWYREYGKAWLSVFSTYFILTIQVLWALPQLFVARIDFDSKICAPTYFEIVSADFYLNKQPVINILLNGALPVLLVFVFTMSTIVKLRIRDQRRRVGARDGSLSARREREMTRQMIVVCVLFGTLCLIVTICVQIIYKINPKTSFEHAISNFVLSILMCSNIGINSSNFFLYVIFGKKFRDNFFSLFCSRRWVWNIISICNEMYSIFVYFPLHHFKLINSSYL